MHIDNWDDLRFVLAMRRHGTMSAAARQLATNVATVSRRLDRIALGLGVPLFEKRGARLEATEAADDLAAVAEALEQTLRGRIADLCAGQHEKRVAFEIAAPPAVHERFVLPRVGSLAAALPHVLVTLTDKVVSEGLGEADVQIRIGRPESGRLIARRFRDVALRVYHRADRPLDADWIGLTRRHAEADLLRRIHLGAARHPRYRVEAMPVARDLAIETGLPVLLPDFVAGDGVLEPADLPGNALPGELWIAYHETRHGDSTLRAVVEWLCEPCHAGPE